MIESLASVPLPDRGPDDKPLEPLLLDPLHVALSEELIEVPVMAWPAAPRRLLRISGQAYNSANQYTYLAQTLGGLLGAGASRVGG